MRLALQPNNPTQPPPPPPSRLSVTHRAPRAVCLSTSHLAVRQCGGGLMMSTRWAGLCAGGRGWPVIISGTRPSPSPQPPPPFCDSSFSWFEAGREARAFEASMAPYEPSMPPYVTRHVCEVMRHVCEVMRQVGELASRHRPLAAEAI